MAGGVGFVVEDAFIRNPGGESMHVAVLNQFYWPSVAATASLLTDVVRAVADAGHRVTVVCSQGDYLGHGARLPARERFDGVEIRRLPASSFGKRSSIHRLLDYGTYSALACFALAVLPRADVYLCLSTPPLLALLGVVAARAHGARLVYWCHDLYPDLAIALGAVSGRGAMAAGLGACSRLALAEASAVVAIGERMAVRLEALGARDPVVIHNWADGAAHAPERDDANAIDAFRCEVSARPDDLLVLHAGNMGLAHDFTAIEAAFAAQRAGELSSDVCFAFVGDGVRRRELEAAARGARVHFLPYQPAERIPVIDRAADVHLVCMDVRVRGLMVPSKMYPALAAGRPLLFAGPVASEPADVIEAAGCGVRVDPGDGRGFVETLNAWHSPQTGAVARHAMGARGRAYFAGRFDRMTGCDAFVSVLASEARNDE